MKKDIAEEFASSRITAKDALELRKLAMKQNKTVSNVIRDLIHEAVSQEKTQSDL